MLCARWACCLISSSLWIAVSDKAFRFTVCEVLASETPALFSVLLQHKSKRTLSSNCPPLPLPPAGCTQNTVKLGNGVLIQRVDCPAVAEADAAPDSRAVDTTSHEAGAVAASRHTARTADATALLAGAEGSACEQQGWSISSWVLSGSSGSSSSRATAVVPDSTANPQQQQEGPAEAAEAFPEGVTVCGGALLPTPQQELDGASHGGSGGSTAAATRSSGVAAGGGGDGGSAGAPTAQLLQRLRADQVGGYWLLGWLDGWLGGGWWVG